MPGSRSVSNELIRFYFLIYLTGTTGFTGFFYSLFPDETMIRTIHKLPGIPAFRLPCFQASQHPSLPASQLTSLFSASKYRLKNFDDRAVRQDAVGFDLVPVDGHHADAGFWNSQIIDQCRRIGIVREFQLEAFFVVVIRDVFH